MNKKQERQHKIVSFIKTSQKVAISDILSFLKDDVDRKTLQRDLADLLQHHIISSSGKGRGVVYFVSSENKIFEEIDLTTYFATPYVERDVKETFDFTIFDLLHRPIFTDSEQKKLSQLHDQFVKNFSRYDSQTLINKEFERILIEFSWKSSAIEGNTYSLLSTETLIKENIADATKTAAETQMILNHKDAFNEIIQNKQRFIVLQYADIAHVHSILTKKLDIAKNIRSLPVGVTGTKYKPLDNSHQIKEALESMIALINQKESVFEKAFLSLILISYIQAFEDGNKRTARMFSNAILLAHHSIPLSYRAVDIKKYKEVSVLFYETNNIFHFKNIFIEQFEDAVKNYFN